ncbi:AAA family ATPase [Neisseriaceae bacterium B1]
MWIQSINLKNFKSYEHAEFHFPEPEGDENIVLIGAENAHGKTTLLEAIYLCFYDKDAEDYLKRAGLNSNERRYADFLQAALHHKAQPRYGQFTMELEIEVCERYMHSVKTFKINRKWHFDHEKKLLIKDNQAYATLHKNGQFELNIDAEEIPNYLNSYALPRG